LKGQAALELVQVPASTLYALSPQDFQGVIPKVVVKEGGLVKVGSPLFVDKATEKINFVSPVSGVVKAIVRGERRKVLNVLVEADGKNESEKFEIRPNMDGCALKELLLQSGLFAFIHQRPYDVTAGANDTPKAIFISTFSKMPLAADFDFVVKGNETYFKKGVKALSLIAEVNVGVSPSQATSALLPLEGAQIHIFDGPNPSGNVGVHINHVNPINKGEIVWTIAPEVVVMIGKFLETGNVDFTRRIAVAGSEVNTPQYYEVKVGAPLSDLLKGQLNSTEHKRIIAGNPLVGQKTDLNGFLPAQVSEVCVLPEGDDTHELFGWIAPRFNQHSTSRSYFSWLMPKKEYAPDCRIKGGERHMIMSSEYERVFPMDIYPSYLVQAIITGDIDRQEMLGIYEVAPEDFAVAEYICSSKLELQRIVREGLDLLKKENS
jgi:Na+-transporting NADH:ubiquinone oxidoreductase subunit A